MKNLIFGIGISLLLICSILGVGASNNLIPDEAIRLRVVGNSNSVYDQDIKVQVRDELQERIYQVLNNSSSIEDSRTKIKDNINYFENVVKQVLENNSYDKGFTINYGLNYFPEKTYKGVTYEEGEYESIVVTIGEGKGDNWWCVLFPPLCILEAEDATDVEYQFFIKEIISKYF